MKKYSVSVAGFLVLDTIFTGIDFGSDSFRRYRSADSGDGGLEPGRLTFAGDLAAFAGKAFDGVLADLTGGRKCAGENLGGPAIVGAVNAAQILYDADMEIRFYGLSGDDARAARLRGILAGFPVKLTLRPEHGATPATYVLADETAHDGKGERTFISDVGVGGIAAAGELPAAFFSARTAWFGGTALVPPLHAKLSHHLARAKAAGMTTVVNTIFDFAAEKASPGQPWKLGDGSPETYRNIDVLLMDWDEACRLSGTSDTAGIARFFSSSGVSAYAVTHGAKQFYLASDGRLFEPLAFTALPVSALADRELAEHPEKRGDTTGCGDNFAGGFVASLLRQSAEGKEGKLSIFDAAAWAAASGGFGCFTLGGAYREREPGEKYRILKRFHDDWLRQIQK